MAKRPPQRPAEQPSGNLPPKPLANNRSPANRPPGPEAKRSAAPKTNRPAGPKANRPPTGQPPAKRPPSAPPASRPKASSAKRHSTRIVVRETEPACFELLAPRCAVDRAEDLEEVRKMVDAGEAEIAVDELRWLLGGCSDFIDAHRLLGEMAMLDGDLQLARGHFGYAFRLGVKAFDVNGRGHLPYRLAGNQAFYESAKGLAFCLRELKKPDLLREVLEIVGRYDPSDPLGMSAFNATN